jgi:hypothetical protein
MGTDLDGSLAVTGKAVVTQTGVVHPLLQAQAPLHDQARGQRCARGGVNLLQCVQVQLRGPWQGAERSKRGAAIYDSLHTNKLWLHVKLESYLWIRCTGRRAVNC